MARKSVSHNVNLGDHFLVRQEELSELMKLREEKVKDEVDRKYGGVLDLCEKLQSSSKDGIVDDPAELNSRQTAFGRNVIPTKKPKTLFQLAWKAMKDPMLIILQVAAAVSIGFAIWTILTKRSTPNVSPTSMSQINTTSSDGTIISETRVTSEALAGSEEDHGSEYEWIEGVAILVAVIVIVLVSAFNDYGKEKQFQALQNQVKREHQVNVIRGGVQKQVLTDDLVVGDVCMLKYGDVVPADGVLLHSQDLSIDESSLTGESDHVKKGPERDISILSGTHVMEGSGRMLVVAVGLSSQTGIVYKLMLGASKEEKKELKKAAEEKRKAEAAKTTERDDPDDDDEEEEDDDQSVLQKKLTLIAKNIGYIGLAFALATTIIIIVRFCYKRYVVEKQEWKTPDDIISIVDAIIIGITILVVAIPEGLPLAVTLTLAVSAKKMMKDHNLVRHLFACETMGCATTICSDKTGTLTTNRMTVMKSFLGDKTCTPVPPKDSFAERMLKLVALGISVNSSYTSQVKPSAGGGPPDQVGNKTECALLQLVNTMEYDYAKIRKDHPEDSFAKVYTFNSNRKSMSTVLSTDRGWRILSKGGAEIIMDKCDYILNANGAPELFTDEKKQDIMDTVVTQMASEGLRTICVAYKDILTSSENPQINEQILDGRPNFQEEKQIVSGLTCLAIFGIEDPVRPEVPAAIAQCRKAGVTVRMVTGDNVATARSIALKCGIISAVEEAKGNAVLEGEEFNRKIRGSNGKVDQKLFDVLYPKLRVLARSTPQDKFTLVEGIINTRASKHREVVAVTGDGTNDAPALKKADVGFAMGIAGTDVAKEASDIILTDDNFNSIVKACMWGRNIYDNICKFLQFQLTVNFSALILTVTASAYLSNTPLKAVPMLWLNLIQDTLASLALSTEPPSDHLLNRKPYGRKSRIVSGLMFRNIVGTGVYQLMVLFLIIFGRDKGILDFLHPEGKPTNTENDTLVFNIFVFMTIFNLINARRIDNGRNVFARFFKNPVFTGILLLMAGTQAVVVNFGGRAFSSSPLNWQEWIACIVMGAGGLIWYQLLVFLPTRGVFSKFSKVKGSVKKSYNLSMA